MSFSSEIESNRTATSAPVDRVELHSGDSSLAVRTRGCFILKGVLDGTNVFYCEEDAAKPKLGASHPMSPVGPYDGVGGQHGFPRWADWHVFRYPEENRLALQAKRSDNGPSLAREFRLTPQKLAIRSVMQNPGDAEVGTSLGEHFYFRSEDERDLQRCTVNGRPLSEITPLDAILRGEPHYWEGFDGSAVDIGLGDKDLRLSVEVSAGEPLSDEETSLNGSLGMLVWHRPDTSSVCFEPTVGFDGQRGSGLILPGYSQVAMTTTIELVR